MFLQPMQRPFNIRNDIIGMLQPNGNPHQPGKYPNCTAFFFGEFAVGGAGWVGGNRAGIPQIGGERTKLKCIQKPPASINSATQHKRDDTAASLHLPLRKRKLWVRRKPRIFHQFHFRTLLQKLRYVQRVGAVPLHP